jgi:hypothetical protein
MYIKIFQSQALPKFTPIEIFGLKRNHLATLVATFLYGCLDPTINTSLMMNDHFVLPRNKEPDW